jgi:RNA polymerase sigma-70 factor (ECF subfamily)
MALVPFRGAREDRAADEAAARVMAAGDHAGLAELYDRHGGAVFSLAVRILGDAGEAEDVTQEVFTQVWRQAGRFDASRGSVPAWLLTIARSRAIDRLRARRAQGDRAAPDAIEKVESGGRAAERVAAPELELIEREQVLRVRQALERLPLPQRVAIELAYYEGLTQAEIAARLQEPLGTVKTRIRLGLLKLRDVLAGRTHPETAV